MDKLEHETTGTSVMTADHPTPKTTKSPAEGLSIPARVLPRRRHRSVRHGRVGASHRRHQGRRGRGALRAARLRNPGRLGASWPPTSWPTSISTARWAPTSARRASASWSTASAARSPTGASRTAISPPRPTASVSTASWLGSACTSTPRSIRPSGSTWACTTSTASRGRCATGTGTRRPARPFSRENPYEYPAGLGLLHPERAGQHGRHHGAGPQRGHALQVRLGHGHRPLHAALAPREALRRRKALGPAVVHAGLRPDRGRGQERRQDPPGRQDAVDQGLASRRDGVHRVQEPRGEEGPHAGRAGLRSAGGLRHGALPERQPLGPPERRVHAGRRGRQAVDHALGHRSEQGRAELSGPRDVHQDGPVGLVLRRSGRAVRHDDQPLAHLPELGPHQRQQSVLASTCSSTTRPATWRAST